MIGNEEFKSIVGAGTFYRASIVVKGIKKRARIPRTHILPLGYMDYCPNLDENQEQRLSDYAAKIIKSSIRQVNSDSVPYLKLDKITRAQDDFGIMERWEPFSEEHQRIGVFGYDGK